MGGIDNQVGWVRWILVVMLALGVRAVGIEMRAFGQQVEAASSQDRIALAVETLKRIEGVDLHANPAVQTAVLNVLAQLRGQAVFVELVRQFGLRDQHAALLEFAAAHPGTAAGADAARLVLEQDGLEAIRGAVAGTNAAVAIGLTEALGHTGDKRAVAILRPVVMDARLDITRRKPAVWALAQSQEGAGELLHLLSAESLPPDTRPRAVAELYAARWPTIRAEAARVAPRASARGDEPLPPLGELLRRSGDPQRGRAVFTREDVGCFKCHVIAGQGTDFGPALGEIGTKLGKEAFYESILDPSAGISFGYEAWTIELQNGDEVYGLLVSETADELAMKTQGGLVSRLKKADIQRRTQQKLSIMPADLQQAMSVQDLVDLVEYLASLRKPAS
jgi:putative heme-binding domain-containing protein